MDKPAATRPRSARPASPAAAKRRRRSAGLDSATRMTLARAAAAYCLIAVVACLVFGQSALRQRVAAAAVVSQQQAAVDAVKPQADAAEASYHELSSDQETNRMRYSGPEAMAMSVKVQSAKDQSQTLRGQQQAAQKALDAAAERARQLGLRLVPLVAVLLIHGLLLGLIIVANPGLLKPAR